MKGESKVKRRLLSLCLSLMIVLTMAVPVFADVEATTMRHSVVYVEAGCQGSAGFLGIAGGTGFFIGEEGKNPTNILTNYHVISTFIDLGSGKEQSSNAFSIFAYWYLENVKGMSYETYSGLSKDEQQTIAQSIFDNYWVKFAGNDQNASFKSMIRVYYDDREFDEAYLVDQGDSTKDMALLRLDKPTDKRAPIALCEPTEEIVRHSVTAIGYPSSSGSVFDPVSQKGENDSTVTGGTVSRLQTQSGTGLRIVQYDASINSGNSGGPLVLDENGAVIAINTWGITSDSNMFFGVSMSEVIPMLNRNNVAFELKEINPETSTTVTESDTETTTESTTEETTTESPGITIFGYTFTYTQCILGGLGLIVLIVAAVLIIRHFLKQKNEKDDGESNGSSGGSSSSSGSGISGKGDIGGKTSVIGGPGNSSRNQGPVNGSGESGQKTGPVSPEPNPNDSLFRVQCVKGALGSRRIAIPKTGQVVMGRNGDCGIVFPSGTKGVSGRHCAVYYENGAVYVRDIGSTYGTFIEPGRRLSANESVKVPEGRTFWLGSENECFRIERKVR